MPATVPGSFELTRYDRMRRSYSIEWFATAAQPRITRQSLRMVGPSFVVADEVRGCDRVRSAGKPDRCSLYLRCPVECLTHNVEGCCALSAGNRTVERGLARAFNQHRKGATQQCQSKFITVIGHKQTMADMHREDRNQ